MKEHPILFSTPMVRAILEGRKTQTRRVIQPQSDVMYCDFDDMGWELIDGKRENYSAYFKLPEASWIAPDKPTWRRMKSQFGEPCDRLWVRETFAYCAGDVYVYRSDYLYDVDSESAMTINMKTGETMPLRWRPSIHMPRKASRITLEIVNVRAERLQDISEEDAMNEGLVSPGAKQNFERLWNGINAARGYGWDANPWVWVVEFKRTA